MIENVKKYKWYLVLSLVYFSVIILLNIIGFINTSNYLFIEIYPGFPVAMILWFIGFIFNIVMFVIFLMRKKWWLLIISGLYIFSPVISLGLFNIGYLGFAATGLRQSIFVHSLITKIIILFTIPVTIWILSLKLLLKKQTSEIS